MDIVGYSMLLTDEQSEALQELNQIVRSTEAAREAEAAGELTVLPTGDGMALVFAGSVEQPVECALEISQALRAQPSLPVRMGIHSGPIHHVKDANGRENIAGVGINIAQRVMDCGDAGHILVSKRVADDLAQQRRWQPYIHELGDVEVKHGVVVSLVNLYAETIGNPTPPSRIGKVHGSIPGSRAGTLKGLSPFARATFILDVLPFDNLGRDQDDAYFCDGVQDEILTRLAIVSDLKVVSRTSTQHFKSSPDNLPQIAKQLGVMHVLDGSVQKSNEQVRVNVQLINALTDAHLWAETFDRKLTDIFAVESEIAKTVAENLKARLNSRAEEVLAERPTENPEAHELYLKGRYLWNRRNTTSLRKAGDYFQQAIDLDPNYALAYAGLADVHSLLPI